MARVKKISAALAWLPGFAPDEDPVQFYGASSDRKTVPAVTASPLVESVPRAENVLPFRRKVEHTAPKQAAVWPHLEQSVFAGLAGDVTKFNANVAAIELLRTLESENRQPTEAERIVLNQYTGWGGLPKALNSDQKDPSWVARAETLKGLLGPEEWKSAHASTPNAHYTSHEVIEAMWNAVRRLGFNGGRILEPAAGIGYFLGAMPEDMARNSSITAIELDDLSGRLLKALYQPFDVRVIHGGFEKTRLPADYFDLAIGNVPFGSYQVPESRNVPFQKFLIHDYFFARALEVVRPGGLVAFITSSGTMDKHDAKVRQYLATKADLVGAIRLPNTAFAVIANTSVTTDILFFQKPLAGKPEKKTWMDVVQVQPGSPLYGEPTNWGRSIYMATNKHFVDNPQWVIGTLKQVSNGFTKTTGCVFDGDLKAALSEKIALLPSGIYSAKEDEASDGKVIKLEPGEQHRPGFRVIDGLVYVIHDGEEAVLYKAPVKTLERIGGMVYIRDAARKLVASQAVTEDEGLLTMYRMSLNIAYDRFVAKHGFIHARANRQAFKGDPDMPLLMALELWDDETETAEKTDIFVRRTVGVFKHVEHCETVQDALVASMVERGRINENRIAELTGISAREAMQELEDTGAVFLDPETGRWETADAYLSGNVRQKLIAAEAAGQRYERNAKALEVVIPSDLTPTEIGARVGSTWIPTDDYEAFLNETFDCDSNKVTFSGMVGAWNIEADYRIRHNVAASQALGTSRANAVDLFEQALNQTVPTVYDPHPKDPDKRVVNQVETIAAREKQQLLKESFVKWLWSDQGRADRLVRLYNDGFNSIVQRRYDGKHLALPGFSQAVRLHDHQNDAIWRQVASGVNTLLAHAVGAGKTLEMICAGMELRRLGKASKPMYAVPNHMLEQFAAEFLRAYPSANILMASKDDLQGDKRRALMSRIATGDWDAVLVTHASFERIKLSDDYMKGFVQNEIDLIADAIKGESQDRGNKIVKELARAKKTWEARLAKLSGNEKKDDLLTFEELGVDWLFIDEAHLFKNLFRHTKMTRVAGLPNSNSERAFDMFVKTRHIMAKHRNRAGVVFATGTPVSNSMAEFWVMQRYLQPKTLDLYQVGTFDTWAGNFGESVTALELAPDGAGYRMQTRFARFVNLPELMSMFGEVADIRTAEMLKLPVPKVVKEIMTSKPTPTLRAYVQALVQRAEAIRNGMVSPKVDNMLAVTNDGRKAALDMRMVAPTAEDPEGSKVWQCATKVHEVWKRTTPFRGTQVVFCDLSTPSSDGRFNVYHDLRRKLVEMGVPGTDIAFIHDYDSDNAKAELFKAVRDGRTRILLGSTSKMGVGTNIQTRLAALHHLDAPWRPSDVEQREGRIVRQGNLNDEVWIFRYVTEASFDSYVWQTLETKARFIAQIMQGDSGLRSAEDVELAALSYAEVKALASGNPLVLEKAGVDTELAKLSVLYSQWDQQQWRNKRELSYLPKQIARTEQIVAGIEKDLSVRQDRSGAKFLMEIGGTRYSERAEAGKALMHAVFGVRDAETVGKFAGFEIVVELNRTTKARHLIVRGEVDYQTGYAETSLGFVKVIENTVNGMDVTLAETCERQAREEKRMADIEAELAKPFEKADRLEWLRQRQREIEVALDLSKGDHQAADEFQEAA